MKVAEEILPQEISCLISLQPELKWPNMGMLHGLEDVPDLSQPPLILLEVEGVAALEVDLDKNEALVMLAEDGLEEASPA